jgi:heptosyltransferase-3
MRIVVYRPGALGDTLLTLPTLAALRSHWPDARITLICRPDIHALTLASGLAASAYSHELPDWACLFANAVARSDLAQHTFGGAEIALVWAPDAERSITQRLHALGVHDALVAAPPPRPGIRQHVGLQLLGALAPLGVAVPAHVGDMRLLEPLLTAPEDAQDVARAAWGRMKGQLSGRAPIAIHPGSGGARKRWPARHFAALLRDLRQDFAPVLVEGSQDGAIVADVLAEAGAVPVARDLSVAGLAAFLARCAGYVGNDSGVTHLAGMLGLPTIALFGPTDPALWAPLGPRVTALRSSTERLDDLAPSVVIAAIRRAV